MSVTRKKPKSGEVKTPKKRRPVVRFLLWALLISLLVLTFIAIYAWSNRISLLENRLRDTLKRNNIDAEFSLSEISSRHAVFDTIKLSRGGQEIFSATSLSTTFEWRQALNGVVDSVEVDGANLTLALDQYGKISLPGADGSTTSGMNDLNALFPIDGLKLDNGAVTFLSPFGTVTGQVNAVLRDLSDFDATVNWQTKSLTYLDYQTSGSGRVIIQERPGSRQLDTTMTLDKVTGSDFVIEDVTVSTNIVPKRDDDRWRLQGEADVGIGQAASTDFQSGEAHFTWNGNIDYKTQPGLKVYAEGDWRAELLQAGMRGAERRRNVANRLSLSEPFSKTPVAQNFAPQLTAHMDLILKQSDIIAAGRLNLGETVTTIALSEPATFIHDGNRLLLEQTDWAPVYRYDQDSRELRLAFHGGLKFPVGINLQETEIVADAEKGWRIDRVKSFKADVRTERTWRQKINAEKTARLSAFQADVIYDASQEPRALTIKGAVNFDGPLPGGFATGLVTSGRMDLAFDDPRNTMVYRPGNDKMIMLSKFETDTDWRAEDISFRLTSTRPLFQRSGIRSAISADLADLKFIAIDKTDTRNLGIMIETAAVTGTIDGTVQTWEIDGDQTKICSEDTPSPGTDIRMDVMALQISRRDDEDIKFVLTSPLADAKTELVDAKGLKIQASGSPQNYRLNYQDGQVKFQADALPILPLTGYVDFQNARFTGKAKTFLPKTQQTPIDVDYQFADGQGSATVHINALTFKPKGLQPQSLLPVLRGKVADVDGSVSATIDLSFDGSGTLRSRGSAQIIDMNIGTLPGPLTRVNTALEFSSFFPLQSLGVNRMTIDSFDPGVPLQNGVVEYSLIPDGVHIQSARWPVGDGFISLEPMSWLYSATENRVVVRVDNIALGAIVDRDLGDGKLSITGNMSGEIPILMSGVNVRAEGGLLEVKDGGIIQYRSAKTDLAGQSSEYADMAFKALQNLDYKTLEIGFDGPLDGLLDMRLVFDGKNDDVLGGQSFLFDVNLEGEMMKLFRNLDPNHYIEGVKRDIEQKRTRENSPVE